MNVIIDQVIKVTSDLYVDNNDGFVRKEPLYYLYLKHPTGGDDVCTDPEPDSIHCERGWFNSACRNCPEPAKLTAKQVEWISSKLIRTGVSPSRFYTLAASND
jgi:hypothetical protein